MAKTELVRWSACAAIFCAWLTTGGFLIRLVGPDRSRIHWTRLAPYCAVAVCVLITYGDKRIVFPVFPLMCVDASLGWHGLLGRVRTRGKRAADELPGPQEC